MIKFLFKKLKILINKILNKTPYIFVTITAWRLASEGYKNYHRKYRRKQQWKIVFYTFFNPIFAYKWFNLLNSPNFKYVSLFRPRLYSKPFRPYISIKWNKKQKLKVILDTYRFIKSKGEAYSRILTEKNGIIIANLMFDNGYEGFLKLGYDDRFRKEGELNLSLECAQFGGKVVSVAFSFEESKNGHWLCIIGCVQGHYSINNQDAFKSTQKLLHGLRPNSFIIYSIQELANHLGCDSIYCAGDSIQAYRRKHIIHLKWAHSIQFNYDQFWNEVGAHSIGKGWFELPLIPGRKQIEEIKSHKRSMYVKRYEMLDNLSLKISDNVKALKIIS